MASATILKELITELRTNVFQFEKEIGVKRNRISAAIDREYDISTEVIDKIIARYPEVNKTWLQTGEGKMLKAETGDELRNKKAFGDKKDEGLVYVPVAAQAGYAKHFTDAIFVSDLERIYIPGLKYSGDDYRYFEVEGDSMYPTLQDGMQVIAQRIEPDYWKDIHNYYIHVIVTESQVMVKRLARGNDKYFVAISDNEDNYPQFFLPIDSIRELWLVKRNLDWRMSPPKEFEIKIKPPEQ